MELEPIIGLEVHCELKTNSKMFSPAKVTYQQSPNTHVHEVDMAMPGTTPSVNYKAVEYAIRVCHALHMDIDEVLCFDRKNYYYSDLPKGYQITQQRRPIGINGYLDIEVDNELIRIDIERLHLEEDTAKQIHNMDCTYIDYNRAGIPLIEIVTKPCLHNGETAKKYLQELQKILIYLDVSDARMEEGSLRCDVNISLKQQNKQTMGIRTEIKNLNSISYVQNAIEYEINRQRQCIENNKPLFQETRRYDENLKKTIVMRLKDEDVDYRYYAEPQILPIRIDHQWIINIKNSLPMLPQQRKSIYIHDYQLSQSDANSLLNHKDLTDFFEETTQICQEYKDITHWLLGDILAYLHKYHMNLSDTKITPHLLVEMIQLIKEEKISSKQAKLICEDMLKDGKTPSMIMKEKGMIMISSHHILIPIINDVLDEHPQLILDYHQGKNKVLGFLVGQIMKKTKGQANPQKVNDILLELLEERKR